MAAPTVGAVLSDILPYLGVKQSFAEGDQAGRVIVMEDLTGLSSKDAQLWLKENGLSAQCLGTEETVTGQIPAAGQSIPGSSEVLLYFGETPEGRQVAVPDFTGMNRQQASDAAGKLGLYILVSGNSGTEANIIASAQSVAKDTQVPVGTTIRLEFADTRVAD